MTKMSKWADVSRETRKYIEKRDKKCIVCGIKKPLTMAHIFISRAKGGKGSKENIVALCPKCHLLIDNPIGNNDYYKGQEYLAYCKRYLQEKENFEANKKFLDELIYKKQITEFKEPILKKFNRCKTCKFLTKRNNKYGTINFYYCKYKKIRINKTTKACNKFKEVL